MRDPKERLQDMLEAIAAIERYSDRDRSILSHGLRSSVCAMCLCTAILRSTRTSYGRQ